MKTIGHILLWAIIASGLCSCGLFTKEKVDINETVFNQPVLSEKVVEEPPKSSERTLGSLWSEASVWNDLYSAKSIRAVGSTVFIKPSARFYQLVDSRIPDPQVELLNPKKNTYEVKNVAKDKFLHDGAYILATVKRVLPRGIYEIESNQPLWIRGKEWETQLNGNIREKDISEEDSVGADAVFDLRVTLPKADEESQRRGEYAKELLEKRKLEVEEARLAEENRKKAEAEKEKAS